MMIKVIKIEYIQSPTEKGILPITILKNQAIFGYKLLL